MLVGKKRYTTRQQPEGEARGAEGGAGEGGDGEEEGGGSQPQDQGLEDDCAPPLKGGFGGQVRLLTQGLEPQAVVQQEQLQEEGGGGQSQGGRGPS